MDDKHYLARITKRTEFASDLWMIRVDPGTDFHFTPGQYATLGAEGDGGRRFERAYSIVSSPYEKELEFFFELVMRGRIVRSEGERIAIQTEQHEFRTAGMRASRASAAAHHGLSKVK